MTEHFGSPHIQVAGLRIWVHGRQYPESTDYWDGNWLMVTVECRAEGAVVSTSGPIIHLSELVEWRSVCESMYRTLAGDAKLHCMEPELEISLSMNKLGQIDMQVDITPNNATQRHWFQFDIDQSYLPEFVSECKNILGEFPLRGSNPS